MANVRTAYEEDELRDMVRLDRSKPFGVVFPPTDEGTHFEQDGINFGASGELVGKLEEMPDATKRKLRARLAQAAGDKAANEARAKAMREFGVSADEIDAALKPKPTPRQQTVGNLPQTPAETTTPEAGEKMDLVAWAKGEQNYQFFKVKKQFGLQHNYEGMQTREDGVNWLIDNGLLDEAEAKF